MQKNIKLVWENKEELSRAAAYYFVTACNRHILLDGKFTVALSGGSTPQQLYRLLATPAFSRNIDWKKVFLFWSDERFVPHTDADSNYRMVQEALLDHIKIPRKNVLAVPTKGHAATCAEAYETTVKNLLGKKPQLDLTLLGMGDDGHTASLFPGTDILHEKKRLVKEAWVESKQTYRISFTYPLINHSKEALFLVAGRTKTPVVKKVFSQKKHGYPVEEVQLQKGTATWMLDGEAAGV